MLLELWLVVAEEDTVIDTLLLGVDVSERSCDGVDVIELLRNCDRDGDPDIVVLNVRD